MKFTLTRYQYFLIILTASAVYFLLGINSIKSWNITYDEADHFSYGLRSIKGYPEKVIAFEDGSCMPVSMINTIPRIVEQLLYPGVVKKDGGVQDITRGRYMTLIAGFFMLILIYVWLSRVASKKAAVIGFVLGSLCPNLISQSSLVTTDAYAALFFLATLFFLHQWYLKPSLKNFIIYSLVFASVFLVKQSLIILVPVCLLFMVIRFAKTKDLPRSLLLFAVFCIINVLVLNIGFQFNYAAAIDFKSSLFKMLDNNTLFNGFVAKILPTPFLQGFDEVMYMESLPTGDIRNLPYIFINGDYVLSGTASKQFFFQTFIFKTPILFLTGWVICLIGSTSARKLSVTLLFSLLPLLILLFFTFFVHSKVGVRHILLVYPFIIMSAAIAFSQLKKPWYISIFALHIFMICNYRNNLLAYTNELVWRNTNKVNLVGSVNLEYNQCRNVQANSSPSNIYAIDHAVSIGDTIRLQMADFFYIPDSLHNKHNIFKNYSILEIDKKNTVTVVKRTAANKINK